MEVNEFKTKALNLITSKKSIDILVASLPENIYYFTGFASIPQQILNASQSYFVFTPDMQKRILVISVSDLPTALENAYNISDYYCYGNFQFAIRGMQNIFSKTIREKIANCYRSPSDALVAALKQLGGERKIIALDESRTPISVWKKICKDLSNPTILSGTDTFSETRMIKHPTEIKILEQSLGITEDAFQETVKQIRIGMSEFTLGLLFSQEVLRRGGYPYLCVVTVDERSAFSDTFNSKNQLIKKGSVIRFDIGCVYNYYRSDIARTVIIGENSKAQRYYKNILNGMEEAISNIREGQTAEAIFNIAIETTKQGIPHYKRHHCGHGIGLEVYDPPSIAPGVQTKLCKNMVLCIETPYYEIGWGGIQVEDTVVVEKNTARYLGNLPHDLVQIEI